MLFCFIYSVGWYDFCLVSSIKIVEQLFAFTDIVFATEGNSWLIYSNKAMYHIRGHKNGLQPIASKELRLPVSAETESHQQLCVLEGDPPQ